jgi:hypothetical protein
MIGLAPHLAGQPIIVKISASAEKSPTGHLGIVDEESPAGQPIGGTSPQAAGQSPGCQHDRCVERPLLILPLNLAGLR